MASSSFTMVYMVVYTVIQCLRYDLLNRFDKPEIFYTTKPVYHLEIVNYHIFAQL